MKQYILCLMSLLLLGCAKPQTSKAPQATEMQTAPTAVTATPATKAPTRMADPEGERILGHCLSIADQLPCEVDLDGDGTLEPTTPPVTSTPKRKF